MRSITWSCPPPCRSQDASWTRAVSRSRAPRFEWVNRARGLLDFPFALDESTRKSAIGISASDGSFSIDSAGASRGLELRVSAEGYESLVESAPTTARTDLLFHLLALDEPARPSITGFVLLPDGAPAAEAHVRYGWNETDAAADGSFELPLDESVPQAAVLAAGLRGYAPGLVLDFGSQVAAASPAAPAPFRIVLGAQTLRLGGRVIDAAGEGRSGWRVAIRAGTLLVEGATPPARAEELGDGARLETTTDSQGRFDLAGLLEREYDVWAYDPLSMQSIEALDVSAVSWTSSFACRTTRSTRASRGRSSLGAERPSPACAWLSSS